MTSMAATPTAPAHPPLVASNVALLNLLYARCRSNTFGYVLAGRGSAATHYRISAGHTIAFLPPFLLRELEYDLTDDVRLLPATMSDSRQWFDLGALFTHIPLTPVCDRRHGWIVEEAQAADVWRRIETCPVPPGIVIDAMWNLTAIWPLEDPLRLEKAADRARAEHMQQVLARALGGPNDMMSVELVTAAQGQPQGYATVPRQSYQHPAIRLPGSRDHARGWQGALVTFGKFSDQRFSADAIERAFATPAPTRAKASPSTQPQKESTR